MINKKVIHSVFENTVVQKPNNIAIETEDVKITYSKVNSLANQIAHLLKSQKIEKGDIVAVFLNQVVVQILSLIGVFKKGAIYLPLDKKYKQNHWGELYTKIKPKALLISDEYFEIVKEYNSIYEYSIPKVIIVTMGSELELQYSVYQYIDGGYVKNEFLGVKEDTNLDVSINGEDPNHIFFTSGSSGKPKAVLGNHKSLSHFIHWETKELQITENDNVGQLTSLSFDASLRDIFLPLMNGARICIPTTKTKEDVNLLSTWIQEEQITILHTVPTMLRLLLNAENTNIKNEVNFPELRYLLLAGEKLYNRDIMSWREKNGTNTCIVNFYGATESTLIKSFHKIENPLYGKPSDSISVGKPISNTALIILNSENKLCNVNEKGSIYIKTPFLSSGYYKDELLTKEKFIQNPLSPEHDIVYKTGDYGKYDSNRNIIVLGREDGVLKINGIRCDINSIESTILELEEVTMVKCLVEDNASIICFYTSETAIEEKIKNHCLQYLPHYEMPSLMIHLEAFPTNANGKIDTIYLKNRIKELAVDIQDYEEPINDIEQEVLIIWKEILKKEQIGTKDSFLSLGGNSIKQVLLRSKIAAAFGIHITIEDLFTYTTIHQQASLISTLIASPSTNTDTIIKPVEKNPEGYAVSNEQLRIWITSQSKEESIAHNMSYNYEIEGDFDVSLFRKAIEKVIERHEILRTSFSINDSGSVVQKVSDSILVDKMLSHYKLDVNTPEDHIKEGIRTFSNDAFDLEKAPLFKLQLQQIGYRKFVLSTLMHHIIGDYTSDQIIIGEVLKLYQSYKANQAAEFKELEIQYKDYASWITKRLENNEFVAEKEFWIDHLKNTFRREKWYLPASVTNYEGEYFVKKIPQELTNQIKRHCSEASQNIMGVFATALGLLIHKINSQREVIIGLPINLRNHPDLMGQVGLYLNVVPLKIKIDSQNNVQAILDETSKNQIKMMDNSFYPFDNIVEDFEQQNGLNLLDRIDLYMNFINHQETSDDVLEGMTVTPRNRETKMSKFPICFYINNRDKDISIRIEYQTNIFDHKEISKLGERFLMCLEQITTTPSTSVQEISLVEEASIPVFTLG